MTPTNQSIMQRLKQETLPLHEQAESHPFQCAMVKGRLPLAGYVAYLKNFLAIHRPLEAHLRSFAHRPPLATILREHQYQEAHLIRDLRFLEADPDDSDRLVVPSGVAIRLYGFSISDPVALLGCHYVLEGSKNGGRFIAGAIRPAYGFPPRDGTYYLDPYGDEQRLRWKEFKDSMQSIHWSERQAEAMIALAKETFEWVIAVLHGLRSFVSGDGPESARSPEPNVTRSPSLGMSSVATSR